jgi:RimJ/RimL family protein N-acetyltransferase
MNSAHPNLTLRRASMGDSELLLDWRNDPITRAFSFSSEDITRKQHKAWLNKTLQDAGCLLLICEIDSKPVGMVRINILDDSNVGQVSINLSPKFRGKGISRQLLRESLELGAQMLDNISQYIAEIHVDNTVSKKIFESIGFVKGPDSQSEDFETYLLDSELLVISQ